jgi:hypothetical protein
MGASERNDLLEVLDDRIGSRSTLITSQLPVKAWHTYLDACGCCAPRGPGSRSRPCSAHDEAAPRFFISFVCRGFVVCTGVWISRVARGCADHGVGWLLDGPLLVLPVLLAARGFTRRLPVSLD